MSKNKYKGKDGTGKKPSNLTDGGFDKSILSNYSQWRKDYSEEKEIADEVIEQENLKVSEEIVESEKVEITDKKSENKDDFDFKSHLINSEIEDNTFVNTSSKQENEDKSELEDKNIEVVEDNEEILTETQRLKLIYGNVTPLHERRRRGMQVEENKSKKGEQKKSKKEKKHSSVDVVPEFIPEEEVNIDNSKSKVAVEKTEDTVDRKPEVKSEKKSEKEIVEKKYEIPKIPKLLKGLFALSILLAVSLVGFFGMKAYYSLSVRYTGIVSGIESKNISFYTENFIYKDTLINNEQAKSLIDELNADELKVKTITNWIKEDVENLKKDSNYVSTKPIRLQKYGKKLGIFDDYKIFVDPMKIKVEESQKVETSILINGNEEKISDKEYEVFPGNVTIFYYDNGVKLKNVLSLFPDEKNEVKTVYYGEDTNYELANEMIKLDTEAKDSSFKIKTRDEESILFVNDKNTGLTVKEFNKLNGTNIKKSDILKVVSKMPWGYTISDGVSYEGESTVNVSASLNDPKLMDIAIAKTLKLLKEFMVARGNKDLTVLTVFTGSALELSKRDVEEVINSGREFLGGYPSVEFDLNSFEVRESEGTYKMFIGGHLLVQETSYRADGRVPDITKVTPIDRKVGFHFIYDKEKKDWFCEIWGITSKYITRDNIKSIDLSKFMIVK